MYAGRQSRMPLKIVRGRISEYHHWVLGSEITPKNCYLQLQDRFFSFCAHDMTIWLRNRKEHVLNSPQTFFQVKIFNNERFEREKKKLFSLKNQIFSANFYSSHSLLYTAFLRHFLAKFKVFAYVLPKISCKHLRDKPRALVWCNHTLWLSANARACS